MSESVRIRVELPDSLRRLAGVGAEVEVELTPGASPTPAAVFDRLEARHPALGGTIREHGSGARRAYIRWFAAGVDISHAAPDAPLPEAVVTGDEPLRVVGAIAGG